MTICGTCRQTIKPPKIETEKQEARPKSRVRIDVPDDAMEKGFVVFHELLSNCGQVLGERGLSYGEETPPYYVLTAVMANFLQGGS